jgi:hypothetical protein
VLLKAEEEKKLPCMTETNDDYIQSLAVVTGTLALISYV